MYYYCTVVVFSLRTSPSVPSRPLVAECCFIVAVEDTPVLFQCCFPSFPQFPLQSRVQSTGDPALKPKSRHGAYYHVAQRQ